MFISMFSFLQYLALMGSREPLVSDAVPTPLMTSSRSYIGSLRGLRGEIAGLL